MKGPLMEASGPPLDPRICALTGETLVELLDRAAERTPDAIFLVMRRGLIDERWTFRQLAERSRRAALTLQRHGVGPGQRVLTWSQNDPWLVAAYFGAWRLGAVIVPLDLRMQTDVAVRIGRKAGATLLLAGPGADESAAAELGVPVVGVSREALDPEAEGAGTEEAGTEGAASQEAAPVDLPVVTPDMHAEILFTSGTTSDPKGVLLTHAQVIHTARVIAQTGMGKGPDRALGIIPLSHMYGQEVPLFFGLISGSTLVFLQALTPSAIGATLRRERITAITLVPQLLTLLMHTIESEARRQGAWTRLERGRRIARWLPLPARRLLFRSLLSSLGPDLRIITCGGAPLSAELQQAWEVMGIVVAQGYGCTECAAVAGHTRTRRRPGTVGRPLAGISVRIAPDGELLVRGPNVMERYWEAPEATAEVLDADGWVHTGDAARIEEHGELVVLGRTRDRIALPNGLKVYPEDIENALYDTGQIRASVALEAAPGRLAAVLVPFEPAATDEALDTAVKRANASLAPHQRVGAWKRWPETDFPRTHTTKVRRDPVRAWYVQVMAAAAPGEPAGEAGAAGAARSGHLPGGASGPAPPAAPGSPAAAADLEREGPRVIRAVVAELHGGEPPEVTLSTPVDALGLDSLGRVTLALRLEEAFAAPVSDDDIAGATDVAALLVAVQRRRGSPPPPPPSWRAFSPAARAIRRVLDLVLVSPLLRVVARPVGVGLEHLEGLAGPVLICPSHSSHLDAPSVRLLLPPAMRERTAVAAAADFFFEGNRAGPVVALAMGAFPFGRLSDVRASLERVADLVGQGWNVMIFPEGTRSLDGRLGPMREGIGLLATSLRVPIVPVHIAGAHEILPKGARLPRRRRGGRVMVRFGAPIVPPPDAGIRETTETVGVALRDLAREAGE